MNKYLLFDNYCYIHQCTLDELIEKEKNKILENDSKAIN